MILPFGLVFTISSNDIWVSFAPCHRSCLVSMAGQSSWIRRVKSLACSEVCSVASITFWKSWAVLNGWALWRGESVSIWAVALSYSGITSVFRTEFLWNQCMKESVDFNCVLPDLILCFILKHWNSCMCIIQFFNLICTHLNLKLVEWMVLLSKHFIGKVVHCMSLNWCIETGKSDCPVD